MANLDSKDKRFSGVNLSLPFGRFLPDSDGSFDQADRQHLLYYYMGVLFGEAVEAAKLDVAASEALVNSLAVSEAAVNNVTLSEATRG